METQVYGALGQPGVGFIMAIVVGALAGWIAEKVTNANMGFFSNILMGIIGGVVGNFLARQLGMMVYGFWANLVSAIVGAVIIIWVYRAIRGQS